MVYKTHSHMVVMACGYTMCSCAYIVASSPCMQALPFLEMMFGGIEQSERKFPLTPFVSSFLSSLFLSARFVLLHASIQERAKSGDEATSIACQAMNIYRSLKV